MTYPPKTIRKPLYISENLYNLAKGIYEKAGFILNEYIRHLIVNDINNHESNQNVVSIEQRKALEKFFMEIKKSEFTKSRFVEAKLKSILK